MSEAYAKAKGGRLKIKGVEIAQYILYRYINRKKHKHHHHHHKKDEAEEKEEEYNLQRFVGKGRILSSGTVITGSGTAFQTELSSGDALIIQHPTTLTEEVRIIKMVVSDLSCAINIPFSSDLISNTAFEYIKKPKEKVDPKLVEKEKRDKLIKEEEDAFGTYAGNLGTTFTYMVKKSGPYGGCKIITEKTKRKMTREELLNERCKKKADRHCM